MARARNIKPGFFTNEQLVECSHQARLFFIGLWTIADREGRLEWRPRKMKAAIFPMEDANIESLAGELSAQGLVVSYKHEGQQLLWIPKFKEHQKPHINEAESVLHPYNQGTKRSGKKPSGSDQGSNHLALNDERGKRNDERGKRNDESTVSGGYPVAFDFWWKSYPRKEGKRAAYAAWEAAKRRLRETMPLLKAVDLLQARCNLFAASPKACGRFVPHPATWLNQGRYDDDPSAWQDDGEAKPTVRAGLDPELFKGASDA